MRLLRSLQGCLSETERTSACIGLENALRNFARASEPDPSVLGQIWLNNGLRLKERGLEQAADAAFRIALHVKPDLFDARRARRRIASRDVSLSPQKLAALEGKFERRLLPIEASQITSGNGANTDYVARHIVCEVGGTWTKALVEKRYVLDQDQMPREALVYAEAAGFPSGRWYKFPEIYASVPETGAFSVLSELVDVANISMPSRLNCISRARALGEMAGDGIRANRQYDFLSRKVRKHQIDETRLECFQENLEPDEFRRLRDTFFLVQEGLQKSIREAAVPTCLNKGDAQGANLLRASDGKIVFIDLGGMKIDLIGSDLAHLALTYHGQAPAKLFQDRLDLVALDAFYKGGRLAEIGISRKQLALGFYNQLFFLAFMRILRPCHRKWAADPTAFTKFAPEYSRKLGELVSFVAANACDVNEKLS